MHNPEATPPPTDIDPFFFGAAPRLLYGCLHRPPAGAAREGGVVICSPVGQEYVRAHRALYQLAVRLAQGGLATLRFDYSGCGDSMGMFEDNGLDQWTEDVQAAAGVLQFRSGARQVWLVGLRLGAALALQAAAAGAPVAGMVLWEPVLRGGRYLEQLADTQRRFIVWLGSLCHRSVNELISSEEVMGYPLTPTLHRQLAGLSPETLGRPFTAPMLTVSNSNDDPDGLESFARSQAGGEFERLADHKPWIEELYKRLIPVTTIERIAEWILRRHP